MPAGSNTPLMPRETCSSAGSIGWNTSIPARTGYVQLPPELFDEDPTKAVEKQIAFAKRNKEKAAPAKA